MERLLELARARVGAHEHRHLLERQPLRVQLPHVGDDAQRRPDHRLRPVRQRRRERLRRAAEPRHETIRELDHLCGRAVVPLEPHDLGVREAPRQREQPLGARPREAVDRLVVVADRAEVVPLAEPEIEQRLLEEVDVLVLVDGEGTPAVVHRRAGGVIALQQACRPLEEVLEVEQPLGRLPPLVLPEHAQRKVGRDRRLVVPEPVAIRLGRETPVLGPLDLGREIAGGPEAERSRQRVADPPQKRCLRGQDPARIALEVAEQRERRRVEGRGAHAVRAERTQPRPELARRLVGERERDDLLRREGAARDLPRDPARDRRRLAGPGAGEDAQRPARCLHSGALFGVQAFEDPLRVQVARG